MGDKFYLNVTKHTHTPSHLPAPQPQAGEARGDQDPVLEGATALDPVLEGPLAQPWGRRWGPGHPRGLGPRHQRCGRG